MTTNNKMFWNSEELKKLIAEHPDYRICVLASDEANCGDYTWMFCTDISCCTGEVLTCECPYDDTFVPTDRSDFEDRLEEWLWDSMCGEDFEPTEEEVKNRLAQEIEKYNDYWENVIFIYATN